MRRTLSARLAETEDYDGDRDDESTGDPSLVEGRRCCGSCEVKQRFFSTGLNEGQQLRNKSETLRR